jgi:PHB/PHA accumulation regulator DNA-binding domain
MARAANKNGDGPIIIKKYANRRLYNTQSSKYITLDFLADLTRKEIDFKVLDAKTNEDITHGVLTQIIMEEENSGQQMLPADRHVWGFDAGNGAPVPRKLDGQFPQESETGSGSDRNCHYIGPIRAYCQAEYRIHAFSAGSTDAEP